MSDMNRLPFQLGITSSPWIQEDSRLSYVDFFNADVLQIVSSLGFAGIEDVHRFTPLPYQLQAVLNDHSLQLVSKRKNVMFSKPAWRKAELESFRQHVEWLKAMNSQSVIVREVGGSVHWDPTCSNREKEVSRLTEEQWCYLVEGLHLAGEICAENDMQLVYQHHVGTVVEKAKEIGKLMDATDPSLVHLLLDTGHAYYSGCDPLALLNHYYERIRSIHLTDIRQSVLNTVREKSMRYTDAVKERVFTLPGDGWIHFKPILKKMIDRRFDGWVMMGWESDSAEADSFVNIAKCKQYIEGIVSCFDEIGDIDGRDNHLSKTDSIRYASL